jgi:hypothetical protein
MKFYALAHPGTHKSWSHNAIDRAGALAHFGDLLGVKLTDQYQETTAPYLLDEWEGAAPRAPQYNISIWVCPKKKAPREQGL